MEEIQKIINQIREEADIFNKAKLLLFLQKKKDVPLKVIAEKLGAKPQYLCHIMRLNRLPEIITDGYYSELISISHLFILARIKNQQELLKAYEQVLAQNLTTAQTDDLVREILHEVKPSNIRLTKEEKEIIINKITQGNKNVSVKIIQTRIKSKLVVEIKGDLAKTTDLLKKLF